jgi:integrase
MLFTPEGHRKYLIAAEWQAFLAAARDAEPEIRSFCMTLAYTGARVSEVRALTVTSIDLATDSIVIECLKRRRRGIYRAVPVPREIILLIDKVHDISKKQSDPSLKTARLWPWCRTTAWARVKEICALAGVPDSVAMPKAFRHSFGVEGVTQANVPLGTIKRWLGHSRLESTLIYTDAVGAEERTLAARMWAHEPRPA